jgi:hypothetical protein
MDIPDPMTITAWWATSGKAVRAGNTETKSTCLICSTRRFDQLADSRGPRGQSVIGALREKLGDRAANAGALQHHGRSDGATA